MSKPTKHLYTDEEWQEILDGLDEEEREILNAFERGELKRSANADEEIAVARIAAQNTLTEPREVRIKVRELYARLAEQRAEELGITCEELMTTVIHKYLSGRLVEKS